MRGGARHQFSSYGLDQREQLWAEGLLCRSVGSDSIFERWECGDLSGEWGAGAIGKLQEVAMGAEAPFLHRSESQRWKRCATQNLGSRSTPAVGAWRENSRFLVASLLGMTNPLVRDDVDSENLLTLFLADGASQFGDDFLRCFDGGRVLVHIERNRADAGVAAAAVALADTGQVHLWHLRSPGIRSHRNFHAETTLAEPNTVDGFRMQVIGNELVVPLEIVIGDVEEDRAVFTLGALFENPDGKFVTLEQRGKQGSNKGLVENIR